MWSGLFTENQIIETDKWRFKAISRLSGLFAVFAIGLANGRNCVKVDALIPQVLIKKYDMDFGRNKVF